MKNSLPLQHERPQGLHERYYIQRVVPVVSGGKTEYELRPVSEDSEYFILKVSGTGNPRHIHASRVAALAYAEAIKDCMPELAKDLIERYSK